MPAWMSPAALAPGALGAAVRDFAGRLFHQGCRRPSRWSSLTGIRSVCLRLWKFTRDRGCEGKQWHGSSVPSSHPALGKKTTLRDKPCYHHSSFKSAPRDGQWVPKAHNFHLLVRNRNKIQVQFLIQFNQEVRDSLEIHQGRNSQLQGNSATQRAQIDGQTSLKTTDTGWILSKISWWVLPRK